MGKNPILQEPEIAERFRQLPEPARAALKDFCGWLYLYARERAETAWKQSKAPMAVYWKAVAAWAYHLKRTVKIENGD